MPDEVASKPARSTETAIAVLEVQVKANSDRMTEVLTQSAANHVEMRRDISDLAKNITDNFVTKNDHESLERKVDKMAESLSWVVRIVLGAVVVAVLGLVLVKGGINVPPH